MVWGMWLGCAAVMPTAEVTDVTLSRITLSDVGVRARVDVSNPWWEPFTVESLAWSFTIGGAIVTAGDLERPVYVRPSGITTLEVPFAVAYSDLATATRAMTEPNVPFALSIDVHAATAGGPWHLPLAFEGALPKLTPPTLDLVDWSADVQGTDLAVDVVVKLGLPAGFALHDGAWELSVDAYRLGHGRFVTRPEGPLHLPFVVSTADTAAAGWSWMQGEAKQITLDLQGAASTPIGIVPLDLHQGFTIGGP